MINCKKYINIDCGVIDYKIKKGMVTTDAFFLSGDNMTVAGKGTIDLSNEQIDYVFLPKILSLHLTGIGSLLSQEVKC